MGEKPLGIDEAPARMGTIAGGAPLGGGDVPPPAMAAGSTTTGSNIKNSGGSNIQSSGSAAAASHLPTGLEPTPTRPGDPLHEAGGTDHPAERVSRFREAFRLAAAESGAEGSDTDPADPPPGIAIKEQGVKYGDGTPAGDAPEVAGGSQPIPGVDIIIMKNPPR